MRASWSFNELRFSAKTWKTSRGKKACDENLDKMS